MRKFTQVSAIALVALGLLPALAFANGNKQNEGNQTKGVSFGTMMRHNSNGMFELKKSDSNSKANLNYGLRQNVNGTVNAISAVGFSLMDSKGTVWTINTSGAKIFTAFGQAISLADVTVNSHASVQGSVSGNVVTASKIVLSPANTHTAAGVGIVTAINGSSFTLQLNNHGIVSSATVNTNASTTVLQNGATTTTSAIAIGSNVVVKGLWNEILNVLNAIKIRIF